MMWDVSCSSLSSVRSLLERDISVSSETVRQLADHSLTHLNWFSSQTRRLLLVEDLVDSIKVRFIQNKLAWWLMLVLCVCVWCRWSYCVFIVSNEMKWCGPIISMAEVWIRLWKHHLETWEMVERCLETQRSSCAEVLPPKAAGQISAETTVAGGAWFTSGHHHHHHGLWIVTERWRSAGTKTQSLVYPRLPPHSKHRLIGSSKFPVAVNMSESAVIEQLPVQMKFWKLLHRCYTHTVCVQIKPLM